MRCHRHARPAWSALVFWLVCLASSNSLAATPGEACRDQASLAEQANGIPDGLLLAIGKHESGVPDSILGTTLPWPWAVNHDGFGQYLSSAESAVAFVRQVQAQGARSIDVGCFQINLAFHPGAFPSLEAAFDPAANASYAARFLASLRVTTGNWSSAVAAYHSADPERGLPYRDAVLSTWRGTNAAVAAFSMPQLIGTSLVQNRNVFALAEKVVPSPKSHFSMGMHVWTPGASVQAVSMTRTRRLAMVNTPSIVSHPFSL